MKLDIVEYASLLSSNTLALPVSARYFFHLTSSEQVPEILAFARDRAVPFLVLGGGSNIVLTTDYPGLVIRNELRGISVTKGDGEDCFVEAGAGEVWDQLVQYCLANGYSGIENLALIPGTVGAAPIQNIGAYGVELSQVFHSLTGWDCREQCWKTLGIDDCQFSYRNSIFKNELKNQFIISSVVLRLSNVAKFNISYPALQQALDEAGIEHASAKEIVDTVIAVRNSKLPNPQELPNTGSFFKNPIVGFERFKVLQKDFPQLVSFPIPTSADKKLSAGWLVEHAGWKGKRLGSVGMHDKQALVLINYENASGLDVMEFAARVQKAVAGKFGIELEIEPDVV